MLNPKKLYFLYSSDRNTTCCDSKPPCVSNSYELQTPDTRSQHQNLQQNQPPTKNVLVATEDQSKLLLLATELYNITIFVTLRYFLYYLSYLSVRLVLSTFVLFSFPLPGFCFLTVSMISFFIFLSGARGDAVG
jgi:hypothetical protein